MALNLRQKFSWPKHVNLYCNTPTFHQFCIAGRLGIWGLQVGNGLTQKCGAHWKTAYPKTQIELSIGSNALVSETEWVSYIVVLEGQHKAYVAWEIIVDKVIPVRYNPTAFDLDVIARTKEKAFWLTCTGIVVNHRHCDWADAFETSRPNCTWWKVLYVKGGIKFGTIHASQKARAQILTAKKTKKTDKITANKEDTIANLRYSIAIKS